MIELVKSNDLVLISFIEALLKDASIAFYTADTHMSVLEGSIGILPRRILVEDASHRRAQRLLVDAELAAFGKNDRLHLLPQ
ncbi:MAG: DUF2007 domain-containing protein [Pseudomonadota bacterium]